MQTFSSDTSKIEEFIQLKGKAMLEVGCGAGRLASELTLKVKSLIAIDPDEAMIELARSSIDGVDFRVGTGEKLAFEDNSFDILLFSYSLHHQNCARALGEAQRVLRNDGRILIIEPAPDGEYTQLVSVFQEHEKTRLRETAAYLRAGHLSIIKEDVYFVNYPFTEEKDLYHHFIDNYMVQKKIGVIDEMNAILGGKQNTRPLIVSDKVNIFLL